MESTLKKYADRIERGEINAHIRCEGLEGGLIFDPLREEVPLSILGFGIYHLSPEYIVRETGEREMVLVPQDGFFEAEIDGKYFSGERKGGPLALGIGKTNASALYVPIGSTLRICGEGEIAFFEAPSMGKKPPFHLQQSAAKVSSRGGWVWRRDIVNLISPRDASTRLVVGETLSPPGFWSGTPLHLHDKDDLGQGESDFEEVYYHRLSPCTPVGSRFDAFGVQLLFDGKNLSKSYILGDKSAVAIPGGAHPVVASPVCSHLYLWGLAGSGADLLARDLPEFIHLKRIEEIIHVLGKGRAPKSVAASEFDSLCSKHGISGDHKVLLLAMLGDQDIRVE
jgi:5-deoxy-glucuronate isomerase